MMPLFTEKNFPVFLKSFTIKDVKTNIKEITLQFSPEK